MKFENQHTQRLTLRQFEARDLNAFAAYRALPEVAAYQSWTDYSRADADHFFEQQQQLTFTQPGTWFQIAIARKDDDQLIGDCVVHFLADDQQQAEIGFTLAPGHQGKGYAAEAIAALLELLFTELKLHRVFAITDVLNAGSVALLERTGFRREGHFLQNVYFKGAWGDEYLYAMLRQDWLIGLEKR